MSNEEFTDSTKQLHTPVILVGNKVDLFMDKVTNPDTEIASYSLRKAGIMFNGVTLTLSAKTGRGVSILKYIIYKCLFNHSLEINKNIKSSKSLVDLLIFQDQDTEESINDDFPDYKSYNFNSNKKRKKEISEPLKISDMINTLQQNFGMKSIQHSMNDLSHANVEESVLESRQSKRSHLQNKLKQLQSL